MRLVRPRSSRLALMSAAAGVSCLTFATPAWALAGTHQSNLSVLASRSDPKGANGTVKIDDDVPVDGSIRNEPKVDCDFAVKFFNFDNDQHANITFNAQPPTGPEKTLLSRNNVVISKDPAAGGKPDPDESFNFSANQLALAGITPHPKQGYHVKLTVDIVGAPGAGKHKVFWLKPCTSSNGGGTTSGGGHGAGGGTTSGGGNSNGGGTTSGGGSAQGGNVPTSPSTSPAAAVAQAPTGPRGLPTTGTAIASIAALGLGLIAAGGGAVLLLRRRRSLSVGA